MDVVVEDGEVLAVGLERIAHKKGNLGIIVRHLARLAADPEGLADDQIDALFGVFAQHPHVIGVGDLLGEDVLDLAGLLRCHQSKVKAGVPFLLNRLSVDAGYLDLLRQRLAARRHHANHQRQGHEQALRNIHPHDPVTSPDFRTGRGGTGTIDFPIKRTCRFERCPLPVQ